MLMVGPKDGALMKGMYLRADGAAHKRSLVEKRLRLMEERVVCSKL
jgi:hypothetical protein